MMNLTRMADLNGAGLSRVLCLPKGKDVHETSICKSYRVAQVPSPKDPDPVPGRSVSACYQLFLRHQIVRSLYCLLTSHADARQGVVHNPKSDKRTTKGVFHVVDDGLPISGDKKVCPSPSALTLTSKSTTLNPKPRLHVSPRPWTLNHAP